MSTYTMTAEIEVRFHLGTDPVGGDDVEVAYPTVEIEFDYVPGSPAVTPRGEYAPIDPPEAAEVSFRSAKLIDGDGLDPFMSPDGQKIVDNWAIDYLDGDEGYAMACDTAEGQRQPDPDDARDRAIEGNYIDNSLLAVTVALICLFVAIPSYGCSPTVMRIPRHIESVLFSGRAHPKLYASLFGTTKTTGPYIRIALAKNCAASFAFGSNGDPRHYFDSGESILPRCVFRINDMANIFVHIFPVLAAFLLFIWATIKLIQAIWHGK